MRDLPDDQSVYKGVDAKSAAVEALLRKRRTATRIEELIADHSLEAERLAYLLTGNRELAGDIAQDAFVRLFTHFKDKSAPEAFRTYLRSTVVNLTRDHWRRERLATAFQAMVRKRSIASQELPPIEEADRMWTALQRISLRQRSALVLRYYEDLSEQQTAEVLGCSVGAVKGLTSRGTRALRKVLEEMDG